MKCVDNVCTKGNSAFHLTPENALVPVECDVGQLRSLFGFFQYRAPNIDSVQSPLLDFEKHEQMLSEMLGSNEKYHFCAHSIKNEDIFSQYALVGNVLCGKCKRFVCKRMTSNAKRDHSRKESDLECLLRHIRNSLAHGHVYVSHAGNYIAVCLEDENDKHNITARIICNQAELRKWKQILERAIKEQKEHDQECPA